MPAHPQPPVRMPRFSRCRLLALTALPLLAWGCAEPTVPEAEGIWGSSEVGLQLTRSGGRVDYACGLGMIDSTWTRTVDGEFTGRGTHTFGGGPLPFDGPPTYPAIYTGQLRGKVFTLRVELPDRGLVFGPYTLKRGVRGVDGPVCLSVAN